MQRRLRQIVIAGGICITVVAVKGNQIRLGVTAPRSVCVDRQEVAERRTGEEVELDLLESEQTALEVA